ncbi:MAG TPA: AIR synthase related protein [Candidatus Dormibacteraeota bacterium]|nr:AIR synthase related protein [Candidatus Dormibacteraeota bacterium]
MTGELDEVVRAVREAPGLRAKASLALVGEVLGAGDWIHGPGDDAAVVDAGGARVVAGGEAIFPPFVAGDPRGAGIAAVVANVNDLCAMGARPLAILDTVVAPEPVARLALEGMRHASALYRVPVVGGHLTVRDGPPSLSAFGIGEARGALLSSRHVAPGQALMLACCLDGSMRTDFPYFSSSAQRGDRLADDVRILPALAEDGICVAARDVSMAGVLGSLAMLLEPTGCGASVDLDALPRPPGVALTTWVVAFPMYGFLLCAEPDAVGECRARFAARDLACEVIAAVDGGGELRVRRGGDERLVLDVRREPVTGLRLSGD